MLQITAVNPATVPGRDRAQTALLPGGRQAAVVADWVADVCCSALAGDVRLPPLDVFGKGCILKELCAFLMESAAIALFSGNGLRDSTMSPTRGALTKRGLSRLARLSDLDEYGCSSPATLPASPSLTCRMHRKERVANFSGFQDSGALLCMIHCTRQVR